MSLRRALALVWASSLWACGGSSVYGPADLSQPSGGSGSTSSSAASTSTTSTSPSSTATPDFRGSGGSVGVVTPPATSEPPAGTQLAAGAGKVLGVFPQESGIFVVITGGVTLRDRSGAQLREWPAPRPLTAAAFDGQYLAVADGAFLTTLRPDFSLVSTATLVEPCAKGVLLSGGLFVCGPAKDTDRIFYTYDVALGTLLASSIPYTYHGIPMRKIPGYDGFITVSIGTSPSDYFLYRKGAKGEAVFVTDSPYHGDFRVDLGFAFVGSPATHLLTPEGLFLKIGGPACEQNPMPYPSECLAKEGALGTLSGGQNIVAADSDASHIYALVSFDSTSFTDGPCGKGCAVQRIDPVGRTILTQQIYKLPPVRVLAAVDDRLADALLVSSVVSSGGFGPDAMPGYRIDLLHY